MESETPRAANPSPLPSDPQCNGSGLTPSVAVDVPEANPVRDPIEETLLRHVVVVPDMAP